MVASSIDSARATVCVVMTAATGSLTTSPGCSVCVLSRPTRPSVMVCARAAAGGNALVTERNATNVVGPTTRATAAETGFMQHLPTHDAIATGACALLQVGALAPAHDDDDDGGSTGRLLCHFS